MINILSKLTHYTGSIMKTQYLAGTLSARLSLFSQGAGCSGTWTGCSCCALWTPPPSSSTPLFVFLLPPGSPWWVSSFLLGLYVSSLASCMGGLYGAPRILQCIAQERVIPALACLGKGVGGWVDGWMDGWMDGWSHEGRDDSIHIDSLLAIDSMCLRMSAQ